MPELNYEVRRAQPDDVEAIAALIREFSRPGYLLPRSTEDIQRTVDLWFVCHSEGELLATGSLLPYSESLAEVRSLAVAEEAQGLGLGGEVLAELMEEAGRRGYQTLFALTRAVPFFERYGFRVSNRIKFPSKVWRDCRVCPFIDDCDESAVVFNLATQQAGGASARSAQEKDVIYVTERD